MIDRKQCVIHGKYQGSVKCQNNTLLHLSISQNVQSRHIGCFCSDSVSVVNHTIKEVAL